jgi:signal transduction histidine kinase
VTSQTLSMLVRGVEDIHVVREQAALLRVAMLVARDEPLEALYGAVSEEVATLLGAEAGAVMRYIGSERAVIVGVHRSGGVRGLPVNAEIDVDTGNSALGRAQRTLLPARATYPVADQAAFAHLMRTVGLKCSVAAPVLLHGEAWGALIVSATEEELLPPGCEQRIVGLAGLLAQALVNADARAELAASRRRLVEAGDELRRRLERELHEGAQQHVVALALKLRVACGRSTPGSEEEKLLADVLTDAMEASAELGEMARGLHPAVLSERGLAAALQALVARSQLPVHLRELPGRRFAPVVETTAYVLAVEAIANATRHAHATECTLRVADEGERLTVEVRDNGIGGAAARPGGGLEVLSDRAAAIGARCFLDSPRGSGTAVRLEIPVER